MEKSSTLASELWPYLLPRIERLVQLGVGGGGGGSVISGAPTPHALGSTHHSGILADAQGPQFLKADGSRALAGNLAVDGGILIDGVDISAHAANPAAHHAPVTVSDGLDLSTQDLAVDVTDFIDTSYGLTENANNIRINLAATSGLEFATGALRIDKKTTSGLMLDADGLAVGAGNGISVAADSVAVNQAYAFAWTANHTHAGNVTFTGAARTITSDGGYNLTLGAAGDLVLDPTGNITLPNAQEMRTVDFSDLVTGISGLRLWDRGDNYRQLTMGAGKFDELYVRVFVANETRIDRGEEYWSKSFGIVNTDFVTPADEATVDVWFDDSPGMVGASLFSAGDWLLLRTIDWGIGLVVQKVWYEVVSLLTNDDTVGEERQEWRIRRKIGGTTGWVVKRGSVALDAGQVGQGWIHLSALLQDGGPYIQMGKMTTAGTASSAPLHTNYVRIGNLNGVGGIATDTWGFAAGMNLGTAIGSGFEGIVLDATPTTGGVRLYNADFRLYSDSVLATLVDKVSGIALRVEDTGLAFIDPVRFITWSTDLTDPLTTLVSGLTAAVDSVSDKTEGWWFTQADDDAVGSRISIQARDATQSASIGIDSRDIVTGNPKLWFSAPESYFSGSIQASGIRGPDVGGSLPITDHDGNIGLSIADGGVVSLTTLRGYGTGNLNVILDQTLPVGGGIEFPLNMTGTFTTAGDTGGVRAAYVSARSAGGDSIATLAGYYAQVYYGNYAGNLTHGFGLVGRVYKDGTATADMLSGLYTSYSVTAAGSVLAVYGLIQNPGVISDGTIGQAFGIDLNQPVVSGSGSVGTATGIRVGAQTVGINNNYGIYIEPCAGPGIYNLNSLISTGTATIGDDMTVAGSLDVLDGDISIVNSSTLGAELLANGGFDSATTSWASDRSGTLASVAGGQSGNCLEVTNGAANAGGAVQAVTTVVGKRYRLQWYYKNGTATQESVYIGTTSGGVEIALISLSTAAAWVQSNYDFVAVGTTTYIRVGNSGSTLGATGYFDTITCKEMLGGDLAVNGAATVVGRAILKAGAITANLTIADDTVVDLIATQGVGVEGFLLVHCGNQANHYAIIAYRVGSSGWCTAVSNSSNPVVVGTTALTDGTADGTDGRVNVAAVAAGSKLQIKNRLGGSRRFNIMVLGA